MMANGALEEVRHLLGVAISSGVTGAIVLGNSQRVAKLHPVKPSAAYLVSQQAGADITSTVVTAAAFSLSKTMLKAI